MQNAKIRVNAMKNVMENGNRKTQGHLKMLRYIEDLIRNKEFKKLLRRLKKLENKERILKGNYDEWAKEEQLKHDYINNEINSIIEGYENLRKRSQKLFTFKSNNVRRTIASYYGLDSELIDLALSKYKKEDEEKRLNLLQFHEEPDMCRVVNDYDEQLNPENKGEEIIYLEPDRQIFLNAFPVSIAIHPRAAKRDVLDFIEKKWSLVEQAISGFNEKGVLKNRNRKHSQTLLDFIWEHQSLPAKKIKTKLDAKFPKNGLLYYDIGKIIQLEKERRSRNLT